MAQKLITIRHTASEWEIIGQYLSDNRINSIQSFINIRLHKAVKALQTIDQEYCNCDKIIKHYFIPPEICADISLMAKQRCVPLADLIQRNFIDPILLENAKKTGILL